MNSPDQAVRFGEGVDQGLEAQKVFPFLYAFVNAEDDTWLGVAPPAVPTKIGNLAGFGPAIAAGATETVGVRLDPDYIFKLLAVRYTAYAIAGAEYRWFDQPAALPVVPPDIEWIVYPYLRALKVSLFSQTDGRYYYGGSGTDQFSISMAENPYRVHNTQGVLDGVGTIRLGHWLPRSGQIIVKITNMHPTDTLYVAGMLSGVKVRI